MTYPSLQIFESIHRFLLYKYEYVIKELIFRYYLILINVNVNSRMWLMAAILNHRALDSRKLLAAY